MTSSVNLIIAYSFLVYFSHLPLTIKSFSSPLGMRYKIFRIADTTAAFLQRNWQQEHLHWLLLYLSMDVNLLFNKITFLDSTFLQKPHRSNVLQRQISVQHLTNNFRITSCASQLKQKPNILHLSPFLFGYILLSQSL